MSKKIISLLLTLMLTVSMVAVAAVSVSAEVDDQGRYTPSEGVPTNRYYFYMPSDWYNDCAFDAGIYWWLGSDAPSAWPGYGAQNADATQVYYCDVPEDSSTIIWNNGFDGGNDATDPDYAKAIQTVDIASQFYSDGDSDIYDSEFFAEMEASYNGDKAALGSFADNFFYDEEYGLGFSFNYDNMIYVINPNMVSENPLSGKITSGGEWYFYYGNGEYGKYPTKEESVEKGTLYSSDYQPAKEAPETEPATDASSTASDIPETTTATVSTDVTEPTTVSTPYLTVNATSNYFPKATAEYNEATNEVTVTYFMKSSKNLLDTQWNLYYDSSVLSVSSKNTAESICPSIGDYAVFNLGLDGVIKYNATNLKLFDFTSEEKAYVSVIFDVKDISESAPVTTTVDLDVNVLRVSKIDPSTLRSDYNEEVMLCNFSEVLENDETKTVQVERRTELTPSTYVEPTTVETTVVETTTVSPTEESTDVTDVTEGTVAPETTVPETTVPETTVPDTTAEPEPTVPYLTVTATSNFFPKATAEYKKSTNEVVVTYWLKSDMNVLDLQWYLTYDSEILTLSENTNEDTVCPVIGDKAVMNTGLKNKIKYNATNLYLFDFSSAETPFAQFTFNVNDLTGKAPATTTIDLNVEVLRVSEINEETLRSDNDKEVILVDNSVIVSDDVIESVGIKTRTVLTPSTFIAPTTAEPETTEPTEPETTVPSEPETTEPTEPETTVPVEPETTEPEEPETTVPAEPETTEPAEPETTEPAEPETTAPAEPETTEPAEPETTEPAEPETTAPSEPETTEPAEPETTEPTEPSTSEPEASTAVETTTEATTSFVDPAASQEVTTIAPATDSTSATGATGSKSTGDTPTSTGGGNNGTVQTGDASLALIILSILVGATCVMFVLRKREMF